MTKTFDDFLKSKHMEEYPAILDDDLPDHFDKWYENLSKDELDKLKNEHLLNE